MDISHHSVLSEDFIREYEDRVVWGYICDKQNLSEDFVREFKVKVFWGYDNLYRNLSPEFIYEMKDMMNKFSMYCCVKNNKITREFIEEKNYENKIHSRFEILQL